MKLKTLDRPCSIECQHTALILLYTIATFAYKHEAALGDNQAFVAFQAAGGVFATLVFVVIVVVS